MEKLQRQTQKIFGGNAPTDDIAVLGSFKSGTPVYTDDVAALQNTAFEEGYGAALIADEAPMLEEQNSVPYVLSKQLAYLFQTGIPEWDENTTYFANTGLCQINGILYKSLTNNNIGNNPTTDNENWELLSFGGNGGRNVGETVFSLLPLDDAGLHLLDGALISGAGAYAAFVAKIAQLYGNGSNVPKYFTTETLWQESVSNYGVCGKFVYNSAANTVRLPKITGIVERTLDANALGDLVQAGLPALVSAGAHTHSRGTMEITGTWKYNVVNEDYPGMQTTGAYTSSSAGNIGGWGFDGDGECRCIQQNFTASRAWTGATSSNGSHTHSYNGNVQTSNTVQPQTIKGFMYIVVANSVKTEIEVDIDKVMTDLNQKLSLSGGTMTGKVRFEIGDQNNAVQVKCGSLSAETPPETRSYRAAVLTTDKNGIRVSNLETMFDSNGNLGTGITTSKVVNGTAEYSSLQALIKPDGTKYATCNASDIAGSILTTQAIKKAQNGYVQLGNGLILQWGKIAKGSNDLVTVTFPKAFSVVYGIHKMFIGGDENSWPSKYFEVSAVTNTSFKTWMASGASYGAYWFALGI